MDNNIFLEKLLDKGILVKLIYFDLSEKTQDLGEIDKEPRRFVYLLKGKWLNLLKEFEEVNDDDTINVSLHEPFILDENIKIDIIEYVNFPDNVMLEDILDPSDTFKQLGDDFLKNHKDYLEKLKNFISDIKEELQNVYIEKLGEYKDLNDDIIRDLLILRLYPEKPLFEKECFINLKNDITKKYFKYNSRENFSQRIVESSILAFKMFGISEKNLNVSDMVFIDALKRRWYSLIEKEKNIMHQNLLKMQDLDLTEEEREEYKEEVEEFKDELDKIIDENMKNLKTAKEVISYWPDILQPKPTFVYED